jgi:cobalt-zinc-cadmium efflux system protein
LTLALALTSSFMIVEALAGFYANSLALLADAGHMLADAGSLSLALLAQHWSQKPRTPRSTYGFIRAEVLAAFLNGIALALTAAFIVREAIGRFFEPRAVMGEGVLLTATLGLIVNLIVAAILMRTRAHNLNLRAAFLHVVMDALGSVAAMLAGLAVILFGMYRADPVLSVLIAGLVAYSGWSILREATSVLLEVAPRHLDVAAIERTILDCPGVRSVHDLHVWRVSDRLDALTVHVTIEEGTHGTEVSRCVAAALRREHRLTHVTVQPEAPPPDELVDIRSSREGRRLTPPS